MTFSNRYYICRDVVSVGLHNKIQYILFLGNGINFVACKEGVYLSESVVLKVKV